MSTDVLGSRAKFGVLGPSTNTIVQPEFDAMRPPGVTNHYSRIFTPNAQAISDESFIAGTATISAGLEDAGSGDRPDPEVLPSEMRRMSEPLPP